MVADLASPRGPGHGTVTLPLWLYWSRPSPTLDLDEPFMARWMYQIVLREAATPEDLTSYLNTGLLTALWPDLHLPKGVRKAWEELHPVLRPARAGRPDAGQRSASPGRGYSARCGRAPRVRTRRR